MALFLFTRKILAGEPIEVFGEGAAERDFTFIDDLIDAIVALSERPPPMPSEGGPVSAADTLSTVAPYRLVNIGGGQPVELARFVDAIEACLGRPVIRKMLPMQPGDAPHTLAAPDLLQALTGFKPQTDIDAGIRSFAEWYQEYYSTSQ